MTSQLRSSSHFSIPAVSSAIAVKVEAVPRAGFERPMHCGEQRLKGSNQGFFHHDKQVFSPSLFFKSSLQVLSQSLLFKSSFQVFFVKLYFQVFLPSLLFKFSSFQVFSPSLRFKFSLLGILLKSFKKKSSFPVFFSSFRPLFNSSVQVSFLKSLFKFYF